MCGSAGSLGVHCVSVVLVSPWLGDLDFGVAGVCGLSVFPWSVSEPHGKSRRCEYGGLVRRRAAFVEKEDSRSGMRSRPKVGPRSTIDCKKDAALLGPQ